MSNRLYVTILVVALAAAGCQANRPISVEVRDHVTREPIAEARVVTRPVHFVTMHWPVLEAGRRPNDGALTDATGIAHLTAPHDHPFELLVLRPHHAPQVGIVNPSEASHEWVTLIAAHDVESIAEETNIDVRLTAD